jgi:electron transfer flavoprotein alpha subunit
VELGVLVKAVPRSEELRYDPVARRTLREQTELVLGPLDQRALRVALELRRTGERVTVFSLGPPAVRPLLGDALALGADRVIHLCDPEFAGSDVLATATALAAALRGQSCEVVLAGARSTDGETGLVGPEIAALLGRSVVTQARSIRRGGVGEPWEVVHDTPRGRATAHLLPPCVLTVGEKIAKPLPVPDDALSRQSEERIVAVGPPTLGLSPGEVGAFASPTTVEGVREVAPSRKGYVFASGPLSSRVAEAIGALTPLLTGGPLVPPPLPWAPAYEPSREVAVLVSDLTGSVSRSAPSVLGLLARSLPTHTVSAVVYGPRPSPGATADLAAAGARRGYLTDPNGSAFDSRDVARGLGTVLQARPKLTAVITEASAFGREVAGQLAAEHRLGVVADAVEVRADLQGRLEWTKPSFGGRTLATIGCRSMPAVATVASGAALPSAVGEGSAVFDWIEGARAVPQAAVARSDAVEEPIDGPEPADADVVVAIGAGLGGLEGIGRLRPVLERWGAALVGTRRVVDAGWLPSRAQVGLTGLQLAPRLAVLLGVRGAVNHTIGWRRAGAILAVNSDPAAPVFASSDVGIVGPVEDVVPALIEPLALALGANRPP